MGIGVALGCGGDAGVGADEDGDEVGDEHIG